MSFYSCSWCPQKSSEEYFSCLYAAMILLKSSLLQLSPSLLAKALNPLFSVRRILAAKEEMWGASFWAALIGYVTHNRTYIEYPLQLYS